MVTLLLRLLRLLPLLCSAHRHVALENLALRHQLAVYKKTVTRPKVRRSDRLFWVALSRVWAGWRQALVIVSPNTVLRWQRRRFCEHWTKLSARPIAGRPPVNAEIKGLVTRMAAANPLWGAPRIHGELRRLGISEGLTAPLSPWQNPFAERLIGSIRRECLNHALVLGESHLRRILTRYFSYYHRARTHLALDKDAPDVRPVELPEAGRIVEIPEVGGLHHRYVRQAA